MQKAIGCRIQNSGAIIQQRNSSGIRILYSLLILTMFKIIFFDAAGTLRGPYDRSDRATAWLARATAERSPANLVALRPVFPRAAARFPARATG